MYASLRQQSLSDQIYETIREGIVTMRFEPGQMLYENELAEMLGVSRTPIRAAIRLLESEKLIEVLPQRGTRVALISVPKVAEVQFIREQLEIGAFRLATRMWNLNQHEQGFEQDENHLRSQQYMEAQIHESLHMQRDAAQEKDFAAFLAHDEAFHKTIIASAGNATLLQVITQMRAHLNRVRHLALQQYQHMDKVIEEHKKLWEAIEQGNEALTVELLSQHIGQLGYVSADLRRVHPQYFTD